MPSECTGTSVTLLLIRAADQVWTERLGHDNRAIPELLLFGSEVGQTTPQELHRVVWKFFIHSEELKQEEVKAARVLTV